MKKAFAIYLYVLVGMLSCVSLSACGGFDDDDQEATYPIELIGGWQGVEADVITVIDGGEPQQSVADLAGMRLAINFNGTAVTYKLREDIEEWQEADRGFWSYKDARLYVSSARGNDIIYDVEALDSNRLVLTSTVKGTDGDGHTFATTTTATYIRLLQ